MYTHWEIASATEICAAAICLSLESVKKYLGCFLTQNRLYLLCVPFSKCLSSCMKVKYENFWSMKY